jgi:hypothetical protein
LFEKYRRGIDTVTKLKDVLERAQAWPEEAQVEIPEIAPEMEAVLHGGVYQASAEELQAIDEADRSGMATDAQVEAAFATFRGR